MYRYMYFNHHNSAAQLCVDYPQYTCGVYMYMHTSEHICWLSNHKGLLL